MVKKPDRPALLSLSLHCDDRGYLHVPLDNMDALGIKRTYIVENHSAGIVRAWHGHRKADTYMHVINGTVKLAAMKMDDHNDIMAKTVSARNPQILFVPAGWYNGAMSITDGTKILVYSTLSFNEVKDDDEREEWNIQGEIWKVRNR